MARFNAQIGAELTPYVPGPAAAGVALIPMIFSFAFGAALARSPYVNGVVLAGVAARW